MAPTPHVSEAVKQLRRWVTLAAAVVSLCALTQMLVFAFAHYTDVRWTEVKSVSQERNLTVVTPAAANPYVAPEAAGSGAETGASPPVPATETAAASGVQIGAGVRGPALERAGQIQVNRVKSAADAVMRRVSSVACGAGTVALIALAVLTALGVIIAGGGAIPGVEKAVTSCVWSLVLALLCLPWDLFGSGLRMPGVFASYEALAASADGLPGSLRGLAAVGQWVGMPLVGAAGALFICAWFRAGVERGVIVTTVSELDRAVEREMRTIAKRGVSAGTTRAVGALNRAVGDVTPARVSPVEEALEEAAGVAASLARETRGSGGGRSLVDEDYRRPI